MKEINLEKNKNLISQFVAKIPTFDEKSVEIGILVPDLDLNSISVLIFFLQFFNAIKLEKKGKDKLNLKIKACSEISGFFLKSLSKYLENDFSLISSWVKQGVNDKRMAKLDWGSEFLYQMEYNRVNLLKDSTPTRNIDVAQVIIKAKIKGISQPMYLVQLDEKIDQYQLIGGKKKKKDLNITNALRREMSEELFRNLFIVKGSYELALLAKERKHFELSPTFGAYTEYTFSIYQLLFEEQDLVLGKGDLWVSEKELRDSKARDGKTIRLTFLPEESIGKSYEDLPLSSRRVQPEIVIEKKNLTEESNEVSKVEKLISEGEKKNLEFKSSIRWDYRQNKQNKDLEINIIKTISGFLNTTGGKLIIGVDDDGKILGLAEDMTTLKKRDLDGYMQFIVSLISDNIGVELVSNIDIEFETINGLNVCLIEVRESSNPVFVKSMNGKDFYVRRGNTTKLLNSEETYRYILNNKG